VPENLPVGVSTSALSISLSFIGASNLSPLTIEIKGEICYKSVECYWTDSFVLI
jgi:hypothetical protein